MKRYTTWILTLVLTMTALAGCGCRRQMTDLTQPTIIPSESTILPEPPTEEATLPSQWESNPSEPWQDDHTELPEEKPSDGNEDATNPDRMRRVRGVH